MLAWELRMNLFEHWFWKHYFSKCNHREFCTKIQLLVFRWILSTLDSFPD